MRSLPHDRLGEAGPESAKGRIEKSKRPIKPLHSKPHPTQAESSARRRAGGRAQWCRQTLRRLALDAGADLPVRS